MDPGDGPVLCFNAHLDVVPPGQVEEWTYPPFGGVVAHERVYGRGAGDDKASVTAQVMAGIALARNQECRFAASLSSTKSRMKRPPDPPG